MPALENKLLKTAEAADRANVDKGTIRRWINAGHLPAQRTATGIFRIDPADLQRVLTMGIASHAKTSD